ncbi:putative transporter Rv2685 [Paraliobacillus ryukyuensis]|uniref:Putative tyrosine transporter P-protein n=1 Tax=Paraliobacillus ryukyuensis TaxID=200904 RepID=A0A366EFW2_9BACI|nr:ArsB/NhaD family transporter [Paraliobacillus ryukyuensis]RBP01287.1 putative tyrosine transporter P-protein [Paraliobacillus ryukyuensis]
MGATFAISVFVICYMFIISEKINQALIALAGGTLLLLTKVYSLEDALNNYIDWETIALLFSMMVLVSITKKTGIFSFIAIYFAQRVNGNPVALLVGMAILTAVGSALLDNVTTVLLFVPVMFTITNMLHLPTFPYLLTIIFSANIGGTATLIGDPPNIMIGQAVEHLTFLSFLNHLGPIVLIIFISMLIFVSHHFKKQLIMQTRSVNELHHMKPASYLKKSPMIYQSIVVLSLTIIGFILHPIIHVDLTTVAVSGAILLLLLTEKELATEKVFQEVEWITLFFFIGLFMLVGGLQEVGVIDELASYIIWATSGDLPLTALLLLWVSGIISQIINNIPFVAAMIPVIKEFQTYGMADVDPLWWSLALGACLGGNGSLIGASANVVVAGLAEGENKAISFFQFLKYGVPLVLFSLVVCTIYVYIRYLLPFLHGL